MQTRIQLTKADRPERYGSLVDEGPPAGGGRPVILEDDDSSGSGPGRPLSPADVVDWEGVCIGPRTADSERLVDRARARGYRLRWASASRAATVPPASRTPRS